jgi:hypothetical protein
MANKSTCRFDRRINKSPNVESNLGLTRKTANLCKPVKDIPRSGQKSPLVCKGGIKINVSIDTDASPSLEEPIKSGPLTKTNPSEN